MLRLRGYYLFVLAGMSSHFDNRYSWGRFMDRHCEYRKKIWQRYKTLESLKWKCLFLAWLQHSNVKSE